MPDVSVEDGRFWESQPGVAFFLTFSNQPLTETATVSFTTKDVTALAGADYVAKSGILSIPADTTSFAVPLELIGDGIYEPTETFEVILKSATGANIIDDIGVCRANAQ